MYYILIVFIFGVVLSEPLCMPSKYALDKLQSGPVSPTVNITVHEYDNMYIYRSVGFTLSGSNGGPNTTRGILIIPEDNVHGGSYSPYAQYLSTIGHHVVILKDITGLDDITVHGLVNIGMNTDEFPELDLDRWVLIGHGRGAQIASNIATIDNGHYIKGLVILASPLINKDTGKHNLIISYANNDIFVDPEVVEDSIRELGSYELYASSMNIGHMDYAYTLCNDIDLVDHEFHFEELPIFTLPLPNSGTRDINGNNRILSNNGGLLLLNTVKSVQYLEDEWISVDKKYFKIASRIFYLDVQVKTNEDGYNVIRDLIDNKRIRITFSPLLGNSEHIIEFYISNNGDIDITKARQYASSLNMLTFLSTGLLDWRYGDQRGIYYTTNNTLDITNQYTYDRWYIYDNNDSNRGIIFFVGGALHPTGYGGIMHLLKQHYHVVIPASPLRYSPLSIGQINSIIDEYPDIEHWTLSGHSMGGYAASEAYYYYPHPKIDSIVMYAGQMSPAVNYTELDLPILNIFGTKDDVSPGGHMRYKNNFGNYNPDVTDFIVVDGANHYYTGDYGDQTDSIAEIGKYEQQETFVNITIDWLNNIQ